LVSQRLERAQQYNDHPRQRGPPRTGRVPPPPPGMK
jgi:hypothetical protein